MLIKSNLPIFLIFDEWFRLKHPDGKGLLEAEYEALDDGLKLFSDLFEEQRFEILEHVAG